MRAFLRVLFLLSVVGLTARHASGDTAPQTTRAAREFVQAFYSWYAADILTKNVGVPWRHALKERRSSFAPQLRRALEEDVAAQSAARGETVGLDFDPFVASQDPDDGYVAGEVSEQHGVFLVSIHGMRAGVKNAAPALVAELDRVHGRWRFRNFQYPQKRDLLTILRSLRSARGSAE